MSLNFVFPYGFAESVFTPDVEFAWPEAAPTPPRPPTPPPLPEIVQVPLSPPTPISELHERAEAKLDILEERARRQRFGNWVSHLIYSEIDWSIPMVDINEGRKCLVRGMNCRGTRTPGDAQHAKHYHNRAHMIWEQMKEEDAEANWEDVSPESPPPRVDLRPTVRITFTPASSDQSSIDAASSIALNLSDDSLPRLVGGIDSTNELYGSSATIPDSMDVDMLLGDDGLERNFRNSLSDRQSSLPIKAFGNVLTVTFTQSRVNQELAKEGVIPFSRFWASGWPFGSPSAGLILHFIPSFIIIVAIPFGNAYNFILDLEGYPGAIINFLVVVGLFHLRWSEPKAERPFKVWWPIAVFYMVGQAFQLVAPFLRPPGGKGDTPPLPYWLYCVVGIGIIVASVVYWFIWWVAAPKLGGYTLEPHNEPLKDGTNVVVYRRIPRQFRES